MYTVYFGNTYIKSFADELSAINLANSFKIFNAEHGTDFKIEIVNA